MKMYFVGKHEEVTQLTQWSGWLQDRASTHGGGRIYRVSTTSYSNPVFYPTCRLLSLGRDKAAEAWRWQITSIWHNGIDWSPFRFHATVLTQKSNLTLLFTLNDVYSSLQTSLLYSWTNQVNTLTWETGSTENKFRIITRPILKCLRQGCENEHGNEINAWWLTAFQTQLSLTLNAQIFANAKDNETHLQYRFWIITSLL